NDVPAEQWNALAGTRTPFLKHEFLSALEKHRCVGATAGWTPQHLLLHDSLGDGEQLVGAVPQYLKTNSYGELVFDWAWADAYHRSGRRYYPKLVVAIPYTPATGPRLLIHPQASQQVVADALIEFSIEHAQASRVSSLHVLFPNDEDLQRCKQHGLMPRLGCQFHWHNSSNNSSPENKGYRDFDDYLDHFTSKNRKKIKRERRQVRESGVILSRLHGNELSEEQWRAVHRHYVSTFDRLGGYATLGLDFFLELSRTMPDQIVIMLAEFENRPVASAICFRDDHSLYGRHWGIDNKWDVRFQNLHFEACYYQGLEYCIEQGLSRFDPGAQGEHKISRGFLPTPTWSAHWIADPQFKSAIQDFLNRETIGMKHYIDELSGHSPFRQESESS
ncbi:GNAT family N-acetyltransferase, partial [Kaarinaea lacus]